MRVFSGTLLRKKLSQALDGASPCVYVRYTMTGTGLRRLRKRLGMSQAVLAEALGMWKNSVARMERGELPVMRTTELAVRYLVLTMELKNQKEG